MISTHSKIRIASDNLNSFTLENTISNPEGRPPIPRSSILKALIYKNLKPFPTLYDLAVDLIDNPSICIKCGLPPTSNPQVHVERLSSFLRDTLNQLLQITCKNLIGELIRLGEIKSKFLAIDSTPIFAQVKENNLKTSVKDRFNKENIP